jgi:hypothetical protein
MVLFLAVTAIVRTAGYRPYHFDYRGSNRLPAVFGVVLVNNGPRGISMATIPDPISAFSTLNHVIHFVFLRPLANDSSHPRRRDEPLAIWFIGILVKNFQYVLMAGNTP